MAGVGPFGSVGTDYREMQGPAQVDTDLPDNGAAARAAQLSQTFKDFAGLSGDIYNQVQTKRGALAGAASGATGHPQYREGLSRFTAYSQAFNNAATAQYSIEAQASADNDAARLRVQANNNPDTFVKTYTAARDAVLKNAPAEAVPMLTELYNERLAAGQAAIRGDQLTEQRTNQRNTLDYGVSRQASRVAILQASTNPQDQLQAQDEQVKLSIMIDGGKNNGLYSDSEAQAMHISTARQITGEVFSTQMDQELIKHDANGMPNGDPMGLLNRFIQAHTDNLADKNAPPILAEPEFEKLRSDAVSKIREYNLAQESSRRDGKTAEELRFEAGQQQYGLMLLTGQLTEQKLADGFRNGDLKYSDMLGLRDRLLSNPRNAVTKSNPAAYARVSGDPNFLDFTVQQIADAPGVSDADKIKLYTEQQARIKSPENTQNVKLAKGAISLALKIPPGTPSGSLSDEQRTGLAAATQEFLQLQQNTDPAKRDGMAATNAQLVIKHEQQREAAAQAAAAQGNMKAFSDHYGPHGAQPTDAKTYERRMQQYQDQIKQAQAAAKGD